MNKKSNESERIRRNSCCQEIRTLLICRFSMRELRRIARKQGMHYRKQTVKYDRHENELKWFENKIYTAMDESIRNSIMKYAQQLFVPSIYINITEEDTSNYTKFEEIVYKIVK